MGVNRKSVRYGRLGCELLEDRRLLAGDLGSDPLDGVGDVPNGPIAGTAQVSGRVWIDANADRRHSDGELGHGGVVVYSDLNFNGTLDDFEPRTESSQDDPATDFDEGGFYNLNELHAGFHTIRQVVPEGFTQTFPNGSVIDPALQPVPMHGDAHVVLLYAQQQVSGFNFGNQEFESGAVSGRKWEDVNGNGVQDAGEQGLAGVVIYSDRNQNGLLDPNEPRVVTSEDIPETDFDEAGLYTLAGLDPGTHFIREVVPEGFVQTFPLLAVPATDAAAAGMGIAEFTVWRDSLGTTGEHAADWDGSNDVGDGDYLAWRSSYTPNIFPPLPILPDGHVVAIVSGGSVDGIDFGNQRIAPGSVRGVKWNDTNGDGVRNANEGGLAGVVIYSDRNFNGILDDDERSTITSQDDPATDFDEAGMYVLEDLERGLHIIREVVPQGYRQTFPLDFGPDPWLPVSEVGILPPGDGGHVLFVGSGQNYEGIDFGNQEIQLGSIHGTKWKDTNGNSQRDSNEPGLPGVVIYADLNGNGEFEDFEPHTVTMEDIPETDFDEAGMYWLEGLAAGDYFIREVVPQGYRQTFPLNSILEEDTDLPSGSFDDEFASIAPERIALEAGQAHLDWLSITIHPSIFVPIEIDLQASDPDVEFLNLGGTIVNGGSGDTSVFDVLIITNADTQDFTIDFIDVHSGSSFGSTLVTVGGTVPDDAHFVQLSPGQSVDGVDFGNEPLANAGVTGRKWEDLNGNAVRDGSEQGLGGVVIYSDLNGNGVLDDAEPRTVTEFDNPITTFDEAGLYSLIDLAPGFHTIREVVPEGYLQTFPEPLFYPIASGTFAPIGPPFSEPGAHFVTLDPGEGRDGLNFGNQPVDPATVSGRKWEDLNGNAQHDANEPGLGGVTIYADLNFNGIFDIGEPSTVTSVDDPTTDFDEAGLYRLANLSPVVTVVNEVVPAGFEQTYPLGNFSPLADGDASSIIAPPYGGHLLFLTSGQNVEDADFGNRRIEPGSVSGVAWNDANANAEFDPSEQGLAGVAIYADLNFNGLRDADEPSTVTAEDNPDTNVNESGAYELAGLPTSGVFVRAERAGFDLTYPLSDIATFFGPGGHYVVLQSGQHQPGIDFGLREGSDGSFVTDPFMAGDYDLDGTVGLADYSLWRESMGQQVTRHAGADGNGNGIVDYADHAVWAANYGHQSQPALLAEPTAAKDEGFAMLVVDEELSEEGIPAMSTAAVTTVGSDASLLLLAREKSNSDNPSAAASELDDAVWGDEDSNKDTRGGLEVSL